MKENTEDTPELNAERYVVNAYGFNCANPNYKQIINAEQKAFIAGANWQSQQSIEHIVEETLNAIVNMKNAKRINFGEDTLLEDGGPVLIVVVEEILSMKQSIIDKLKNK